jgi:hypothetical protein
VCAYRGFEAPPKDFDICPCCGTEFGVDDFGITEEDTVMAQRRLRSEWFRNGASWFDPGTPQPAAWDPYEQLLASPFSARVSSRDVAGTVHSTLTTTTRLLGRPARLRYA